MQIKEHPTIKNVFVSDTGLVFESVNSLRNVSKYPVTVLSNFHTDRYGYIIVTLKIETCKLNNFIERKKFKIHRLVAETFIPNYSKDLFVDHINKDTKDNCLSNLRMVTREQSNKENRTTNNKHTTKQQRLEVLTLYKLGKSSKEISIITGIKVNTIAEAIRSSSRIWKRERAEIIS